MHSDFDLSSISTSEGMSHNSRCYAKKIDKGASRGCKPINLLFNQASLSNESVSKKQKTSHETSDDTPSSVSTPIVTPPTRSSTEEIVTPSTRSTLDNSQSDHFLVDLNTFIERTDVLVQCQ